jgi:hypothetical protein
MILFRLREGSVCLMVVSFPCSGNCLTRRMGTPARATVQDVAHHPSTNELAFGEL